MKVANVLELTDIALEGLRLHASPPELASIVRAFDAVTNAERAMARIEAARAELSDASATLKALLDRTLSSPGPMNEIGEAARRIEKRAPAERHRIGAGLRELASGKTRRPKAEATETATRKRAR